MKKCFALFSALAFSAVMLYSGNVSPLDPDAVYEVVPKEDTLVSRNSSRIKLMGILPVERKIDRGINDICFVYKGEVALGLDVSYGTLTSNDTDFMLFLDDIRLNGNIFSVNPSVGYFVKDNLCIGVRAGYMSLNGRLSNISIDPGPGSDLSLSLSGVGLNSSIARMGFFMRSYAGIDPKGHFGLFAQLELEGKAGTTVFRYDMGDGPKTTDSRSMQIRLAFSSGVAVYIMPNVCFDISFGLGGITYNRILQKDAVGKSTGSRTAASMKWKLNLLDIGIGFNVHL